MVIDLPEQILPEAVDFSEIIDLPEQISPKTPLRETTDMSVVIDLPEEVLPLTIDTDTTRTIATRDEPVLKRELYLNTVFLVDQKTIKRFICDICNRELSTKIGLKKHKETHNKPSEKQQSTVCKFCSKKFANNDSRKAHEKLHAKKLAIIS